MGGFFSHTIFRCVKKACFFCAQKEKICLNIYRLNRDKGLRVPQKIIGGSTMKKLKRDNVILTGIFLGLMIFKVLAPDAAYAALPWEGPLEELEESITGTVAKVITAIVVCVSGMMIAMGEGGAAGRLALRLVFGLALAIGFMQIVSMF